MIQRFKQWLREQVKRHFCLYDTADLQVGANCGLCGAWMPGAIASIYYAWDICKACLVKYGGRDHA